MSQYYVYIMTNRSQTLYTGATNNLERRVFEHQQKLVEGFTKKYNLTHLVYYETTSDVEAALKREKQIKGWLRSKKVALIESVNPQWRDLSEDWYPVKLDPSSFQGRTQGDTKVWPMLLTTPSPFAQAPRVRRQEAIQKELMP